MGAKIDGRVLDYLESQLRAGRMMAFTGSGFSRDCVDAKGGALPTGDELRRELWDLCFPGEQDDGSQLQDLFQHALRSNRDGLTSLLKRRLCVVTDSIPPYFQLYFELPWRRMYTLNVDNLARAAEKRFELPRRVRALSALTGDQEPARPDTGVLEVVHLNGQVEHAPLGVTFARTQYAGRLAEPDRWYARLVHDLRHHPFAFVGTRLDEAPLWQHVELRRRERDDLDERPWSFLVTPALDRARRTLLSDLNIDWLPLSSKEFAEEVLAPVAQRLQRSGTIRSPEGPGVHL